MIAELAAQGYTLELDGVPGSDISPLVLWHFRVVDVELSEWSLDEAAAFVAMLRQQGIIALASGLRSHAEREHARAAGFQWFTGTFMSTPNMLGGAPIPIGDLNTINELCRLQRAGAPLEEVVALIEREVGLGVRLLKYINSAYFGFDGRVRSIAQAAALLGTRDVSRWALMVTALGGSKPVPRELALAALTRARACELVAERQGDPIDKDELFTVGLLSSCDAIFRMPIERLVRELPLAEHVEQALLNHSGSTGAVLAAAIAYEQGSFSDPALSATLQSNATAYREALGWARAAVQETA